MIRYDNYRRLRTEASLTPDQGGNETRKEAATKALSDTRIGGFYRFIYWLRYSLTMQPSENKGHIDTHGALSNDENLWKFCEEYKQALTAIVPPKNRTPDVYGESDDPREHVYNTSGSAGITVYKPLNVEEEASSRVVSARELAGSSQQKTTNTSPTAISTRVLEETSGLNVTASPADKYHECLHKFIQESSKLEILHN